MLVKPPLVRNAVGKFVLIIRPEGKKLPEFLADLKNGQGDPFGKFVLPKAIFHQPDLSFPKIGRDFFVDTLITENSDPPVPDHEQDQDAVPVLRPRHPDPFKDLARFGHHIALQAPLEVNPDLAGRILFGFPNR